MMVTMSRILCRKFCESTKSLFYVHCRRYCRYHNEIPALIPKREVPCISNYCFDFKLGQWFGLLG